MRFSPSLAVLAFISFLHLNAVQAAEISLSYKLSFDQADQHFVEVKLQLEHLKESENTLVLPVWTPGYYKILDNPAHILDFQVSDKNGKQVNWHKSSKNKWVLENGLAQNLVINYRVYANRKSVAESHIDENKAFLAATDIFMFLENHKDLPVAVEVQLPEFWNSIATGLETSGKNQFLASDVDVLYDSPIYLGNQKMITFDHEGHDFTLSLAQPEGLDEAAFIKDLRSIISSTTQLMGDNPFEDYVFIMMEAGGGGLEHQNSQAIFTYGGFNFKSEAHYKSFLNFVTHEYFHLYNVKAIRPIELGPFDYSAENYTTMLWVAEGFTVYYEYLIMQRAKLIEGEEVLGYLSEHITAIEGKEGKNHMSLERSSFDVWNHFLNNNDISDSTTISYYQKGPIIGLLLDLAIRHESQNQKSLDDVMRFLYTAYYQERERGYTEDEFWDAVTQMAGTSLDEIRNYVETTAAIDYSKYLNYAALRLTEATKIDSQTQEEQKVYKLIQEKPETKLQAAIQKELLGFKP